LRLGPKGLLPRVAVPLLTVWPAPLMVPPVQVHRPSTVTVPGPVRVPPVWVRVCASRLAEPVTVTVPPVRERPFVEVSAANNRLPLLTVRVA